MLLFRSEEHVDRWGQAKGIGRGAAFSLDQAWTLGRVWYADRLSPGWSRRTAEEAEPVFAELGLLGPFWRLRS